MPAKPLVFVHGFACTHADWRSQLAKYGEEHDVFAPDLHVHLEFAAGSPPIAPAPRPQPQLAVAHETLLPARKAIIRFRAAVEREVAGL